MTNFKKSIIALAVVGAGTAVLMGSLVLAQSTSPSLTINGVTNNTFYVGQSWTLSISGAPANTTFSLCTSNSCTPVTSLESTNAVSGPTTTDANGNWAGTGSFASVTNGSFIEWAQFPNGTTSNNILFAVNQTAPVTAVACNGTGAAGICSEAQGTICINPGTASSYCGLPNAPQGETISSILAAAPAVMVPVGSTNSLVKPSSAGECQNDISSNQSDLNACEGYFEAEASALGYTANCVPDNITPATEAGDIYDIYGYVCTVSGNGVLGQISPSCAQVAPQDIAGYQGSAYTSWGEFVTGETCSNSSSESTTSGSGSTISGTGSTSGTTSTGTNGGLTTSGTTATTGTGSTNTVSTESAVLNSSLISSWAADSEALTNTNGGTTGTTSGTGTTAAGTNSSATTTGSSSACVSAANSTIANSVQTLQGLEGILSSSNVSPGVLTSVQNLINAVAQVLTSLSTCISNGQ